MYQGWLWYVKGMLRYGLNSGLATWRSNLIGCSGQTVLNLKNLFDVFYQAWPEDHVCQVSRWLENICDRRCILKVFDINQDGGKSIITQNNVIGCFELGLTKASNDPLFVNIGRMGRKLWTWMHVQLSPDGGAKADELATSDLLHGLMGLSWTSVPNLTTFDQGVLWAAIDSHDWIIIIGIHTKTIGFWVSSKNWARACFFCSEQLDYEQYWFFKIHF